MQMTENLFRQDSKQIVDMMFDLKLLKDSITRNQMSEFEDLIQFILQSKHDTYIKGYELLKKLKETTK